MKPITEGTSVKISSLIRDEDGVPVVPVEYYMWAKNTGYSKKPIVIDAEVVNGRIVGYFIPPDPGVWHIGIEVVDPVVVTENQSIVVAELSAKP